MPRVVHFEIHASEPERAIRFYRDLFGWQFNKWSGPVDYWLVVTGPREEPGIDGGLVRQVALEKMPVPGVGWLAYLKDPEGNIFGIMQNDPAAK